MQLLNGRFVHILVVEDLMAELIDPNCKEYHQTCEAYVLLARSFVIVEKISFHFCFFFSPHMCHSFRKLGFERLTKYLALLYEEFMVDERVKLKL